MAVASTGAGTLTIRNRLSPLNASRPPRLTTTFIILHTTEAPTRSSLNEVYRYGETHYLVDWEGTVYRIIDRKKVAFHCGRSLWDGLSNLDDHSIGVEVVGYYDRDLNPRQYAALKELLSELKQIYRVPDSRILPHCMVAYGTPNRWHRHAHRGRKRCGLLFAMPDVRARLGLGDRPRSDPDVAAGRLIAADPYLEQALYGTKAGSVAQLGGGGGPGAALQTERVVGRGQTAWEVAGAQYRSADVTYIFPGGMKKRGDEIGDWKRIPAGTRIVGTWAGANGTEGPLRELGRHGNSAVELAGDEYRAPTTFYFLPGGSVRPGDEMSEAQLQGLAAGTKVLVGYRRGGPVSRGVSVYQICGSLWSSPDTFYVFPDGSLRAGDTIVEKNIPPGTTVFFRN